MYREEQFLRYLDNELPPEDRAEVEQTLASDPAARQQMEILRSGRESLLSALDSLNPPGEVKVPAFRSPAPFGIRIRPRLRYAAAAVLLLAAGLTIWQLNHRRIDRQAEPGLTALEKELQEEALDCYISPNRCWNERKLPLIILEIKLTSLNYESNTILHHQPFPSLRDRSFCTET